MARKSIIIIGAGMGGLAAGIYGQMNGFATRIFEMHSKPGGQCAAWKRKGYIFDACIHHLFGCDPSSRIYDLWQELGAMPRDLVPIRECVSVVSPDGRLFHDYYDLDYINGIRKMVNKDFFGEAMMGSGRGLLRTLPAILSSLKWSKTTMQQYGDRFFDPFLKRAFPLLEYSLPEIPFLLHLAKHANGSTKAIQWPVGGSREFSRSIEKRYRELGGETHYKQKVEKILTENNAAKEVRLSDESEHRADFVISDADGRKTIMDLLEGRYINERIRGYCAPPRDETNWAVHVFLGVNSDLSREPSALVMLLEKPLDIAGHVHGSLEMQIYGFDRTMAPEGKGVIKVELVSSYSFWKKLHVDRQRYDEEKQKVAEQVVDALEALFKGIKSQVEVIDVPTLMTWERYMGGTHGFAGMPNRKANIIKSLIGKGQETTLPGLSNFHMVGQWVTSAGALFSNALSGRNVIKTICKQEGRKFITR
jgi:phytoene dehydrogenase-like protein